MLHKTQLLAFLGKAGKTGGPFLLLVNGISRVLLTNSVSRLLITGGAPASSYTPTYYFLGF